MKRKLALTLALALAVLGAVTSCKKAPLMVGKTVTQVRNLGHFDTLTVNDDINLILIKSDENKIEITAGENLIDNIATTIGEADSTLTISNLNSLNWIRTYDYSIDAKLYFKDICHINFTSSGYLKTENQFNSDTTYTPHSGDTISFHPKYELLINGSSGDIDMEFNNCDHLMVNYDYGTSNVKIRGRNNIKLEVYKQSYGSVDAQDFESQRVIIWNFSTNDCSVWATEYLWSYIGNLGNIYYKGNPTKIVENYSQDAKGRLIRGD